MYVCLYVCLYVCVCVCVCMCECVYVCMYVHIHTKKGPTSTSKGSATSFLSVVGFLAKNKEKIVIVYYAEIMSIEN